MPTDRSGVRRSTAAAAVVLVLLFARPVPGVSRDTLPASLTDAEFWSLTEKLSEPGGYFQSSSGSPDNLLSNENDISTIAAGLERTVKPAGVYLGVGPEQNFTYIAAMRPRLAFITDIRRGNLHLHLLYKAIFELSDDRASFVARLFSRKPYAGLPPTASADQLMSAFLSAPPVDQEGFQANFAAVIAHLTKTRKLPLGKDDLDGIAYVYRNFHQFGPAIFYTASIGGRSNSSTYAAIMASRDRASGEARTYLATAERYALVRAIQRKNLIVPIVGDFAGPKALRAVGEYLRERGAVLSAFYVSNVESYLNRNRVLPAFCANVASMPLDAGSVFIRAGGPVPFSSMQTETAACRGGVDR
jgi:hypothetical protein